jgi:asparagine synthase (glutamine-hydrolysing)
MCGILAILGNADGYSNNHFLRNNGRGPEFSIIQSYHPTLVLGFHRLAINGLNAISHQPLILHNITLVCNGEIYNYKDMYKTMNIVPTTGSDCEVIIHMYLKYGIEHTLRMLDGVFAFVLYDNRDTECPIVIVSRDPFGVRPLYKAVSKDTIVFGSELKYINQTYRGATQFEPGTYETYSLNTLTQTSKVTYFTPCFPCWNIPSQDIEKTYYIGVRREIQYAVEKRCFTTERPIACLLSGGLDSSLIAALVNQYYKKSGRVLETYSIGLAESEDLKYARIVADYIGSKHTEIVVSEDDMFKAIPDVIYAIESYDTTTVRASIGNYLLGKYISTHSDAKVIFNGDGSDELFGGYLYMAKCPDDIEFDRETRRLLKDIHLYDVLRSDKSISSHGLEPRTPFLDRGFVNYCLSIPPNVRREHTEKSLLRKSFSWLKLLPDSVLWRRKEAFSDGVSSKDRSLFQILQEKIAAKLGTDQATIETEKHYYKTLFDQYYPDCTDIVPYLWMPKYTTNTNDPSARTLDIY